MQRCQERLHALRTRSAVAAAHAGLWRELESSPDRFLL